MFQTLFYQPILNLLVFLYNIVPGHDLGIAIILLTVAIKLVLWPLSKQALESQKNLQELQPDIERIKKEHKDNKEELGKQTMQLYKDKKINPFSSCLPLLVQLPFFIAVFHVFRDGFANKSLELVYPFIVKPEVINTISLGTIDLANKNIVLAVAAGAAQFWQAKITMSTNKNVGQKNDFQEIMNKQMLYFMPVLTIIIGTTLPGGLALYWLTTTFLTILQQNMVAKNIKTPIKTLEGEIIN